MTEIIKHRGPDDEGYICIDIDSDIVNIYGGNSTPQSSYGQVFSYLPEHNINDHTAHQFNIGLGHRRLSILDVSAAGHQPLSYDNGRFWIVFNGEIYNYLEIKEELLLKGYTFLSNSDTEVVLASYQEWGVDCQHKFVGMWSLILFDRQSKEIFASRDRYGIKPLYYWVSDDQVLYFASEIKQFTVQNTWKAKINSKRVADFLIYSLTDHTDETMFEHVFHVPSGHYFKSKLSEIEFSSKKIKTERWYTVSTTPFKGSFEDATLEFERLFKDAVRLHLRADVPVGSALSGGLDSSSIVCEVNALLRNEGAEQLQKTFSSCSVYSEYDERKWMEIVVNHVQVDAHYIYPKLEDVFTLTPKLVWHQDEPYTSQSAFLANHIFKEANHNKVKVLLNGQGADEYLGGYGQFTVPYFANLLLKLRFGALKAHLKRDLVKPVLIKALTMLLPASLCKIITRKFGHYTYISELINLPKVPRNHHPFDDIPVGLNDVPSISKHLTFYSSLPKYLRWEDRNSMSYSIEARVPFLDHRLVEFCQSLPYAYLEKNGIKKSILRESLRNILPSEIKDRKDKMGFTTPEEKWLTKEAPDLFRTKMKEAIAISNGIIKPEAIDYLDKIIKGELPFDYTYWRFILLAEWIVQFEVSL